MKRYALERFNPFGPCDGLEIWILLEDGEDGGEALSVCAEGSDAGHQTHMSLSSNMFEPRDWTVAPEHRAMSSGRLAR